MRRLKRAGAAALIVAGLCAPALPAQSESPQVEKPLFGKSERYPAGEPVVIQGTISAADGRPLAGVDVSLTGYRKSFDIWRLRRTKKGDYTIRTVTGADGRFEIGWRWDDFYNRFELRAGVRTEIAPDLEPIAEDAPAATPDSSTPTSGVAEPASSDFLVLAEADLSKRIRQGSPVVTPLTIEDTEQLESWQGFLATVEGREQRRVYQELGKPDKVQRVDLTSHGEVDWWYFERGKVYRFRDGEIESIEEFEPVVPGSS